MFDIYHVRYKKIIFTEEMRTDKRFLESMNSIASILVLKKKNFHQKNFMKIKSFKNLHTCTIKCYSPDRIK